MTRKYNTTEINGFDYELHGVKVEKKSIGSVPVRVFADKHDFLLFVQDATDGNLELIVEDYKYGLAVRLQGMARKCVTGESFGDAQFGKIFNDTNIITTEILLQFHGDSAGLKAYCKDIYDKQQADGDEYGEDYVWDELVQ